MGLKEDIKSYIAEKGWTLTKLADELNKRNGSDYTVQNLSNKIRKESLKFNEVVQIADILGYKILWQPKSPDDYVNPDQIDMFKDHLIDENDTIPTGFHTFANQEIIDTQHVQQTKLTIDKLEDMIDETIYHIFLKRIEEFKQDHNTLNFDITFKKDKE